MEFNKCKEPLVESLKEYKSGRIIIWGIVIVQLLILSMWLTAVVGKNLLDLPENEHNHFSTYMLEETDLRSELSKEDKTECTIKNDNEKFDCYPQPGGNEKACLERKCCWMKVNSKNVPWCYYPHNYGGYKVINETSTQRGKRLFMSRTFPSGYPDDVKLIRMDVEVLGSDIVHVKIIDANANRYEAPYPEIPTMPESPKTNSLHKVKVDSSGIKITQGRDIVFESPNVGGFIFADQFLQHSFKLFENVYGLGQHQTSLSLSTNWTKYTMFNRDGIPMPNANLYGSHPFLLSMDPKGRCIGIFFHNSNAMEVLLQPLPGVTFRSIGGIFNFYFFLGPTPADVIKQYTAIIGRPFLPPYWSLGFHLSRFGYKTAEDMKKVWKRTRAAKIPFDTQWNDLDYMDKRNDFTYDNKTYEGLPKFVKEIHDDGMRYVIILDPGVSGCEPKGTYPPFDEGVASDIFVKNENDSIFVGKVWNRNCTVFPDFTAIGAAPYWSKQIKNFHKKVPFDGLWIDMNEPSNFLDGGIGGCPSNKWEDPPYLPDVIGKNLRSKTICMSAKQAAGRHYDVHNLYGISETIATNKALKMLGKRPFIISRSTYPGSGKYGGHWSGDVVSTWHDMKLSIPQMLAFNMFGIPMTGADICGFNGNTTAFLCKRWSQLGAFYPFSRNHNSDDCIDQDPASFGEDVINSTRKALNVRYTLLPYLYTLFFKGHTEGETVARPLFFEFWNDPKTHELDESFIFYCGCVYRFWNDPKTHELDESFLWGCCLLIVPVLKEHKTTVTTYLPAGRWYNWYSHLGRESQGTTIDLHAASDTIPVLIRGGGIIPTQQSDVTTTLSRKNDIELIVASNTSLNAFGSLYWDDGESLDVDKTKQYGLVNFTLTPTKLISQVTHWDCKDVPSIGSIKILGFVRIIQSLELNKKKIKFKWDSTSLVLRMNIKHPVNVPFVIEWKLEGHDKFRSKSFS